ncbi:MAG: questin oxidase family protein [Calothrix sp. MO_167.B42]|nr:questin oxidase family protein [Calothrix sp. MO_167.B42]
MNRPEDANFLLPDSYYKAPNMNVSLARWLDRARQWDIEYGGYLSNHITHNWVVMGAAGASDAQMQWWEDLYTFKLAEKPAREPGDLEPPLVPLPDQVEITDENWRDRLESNREAYPAYRDFFDARVAKLGVSTVLREYLPALLPGLAGAALHPVIHTGWGFEANHADMICDGLAYMATLYQPLATDTGHTPPNALWSSDAAGPIEASLIFLSKASKSDLSRIDLEASKTEPYQKLKRGEFQHRIIAFNDPKLPLGAALNAAAPLGLPGVEEPLNNAIEEMAVTIAAALRGSDNEFFVLHGLTSLHAILSLVPHLEANDQRLALAYWWRAAMATMVSQDLPGLSQTVDILKDWRNHRQAQKQPDAHQLSDEEKTWWLTALKGTLTSHDEHVPKAVYALWRWAEWGVFSKNTIMVFEDTAKNLIKPHPSGQIHQNLWFSRAFSKASKAREGKQVISQK